MGSPYDLLSFEEAKRAFLLPHKEASLLASSKRRERSHAVQKPALLRSGNRAQAHNPSGSLSSFCERKYAFVARLRSFAYL